MEILIKIYEHGIGGDFGKATLVVLYTLLLISIMYPYWYTKYNKHGFISKYLNIYLFLSYFEMSFGLKSRYKKYQAKEYTFANTIRLYKYHKKSVGRVSFESEYYVEPDIREIRDNIDRIVPQNCSLNRRDEDKIRKSQNKIPYLIDCLKEARSRVIVRGVPGLGKSNLCNFISHYFSKDSHFNSVFLLKVKDVHETLKGSKDQKYREICTLKSPAYALPFLIRKSYGHKNIADITSIRRKIKGKSLVVVDGLDEIGSLELRDDFIKILMQGLANTQSSLLLTGRPNSFTNLRINSIKSFRMFEILNFTRKQVRQLVENIYTFQKENESEEETSGIIYTSRYVSDFMRRVRGATMEMASNPFLLTLMVQLDLIGKKKLPSSKPELIEMVIEESILRREDHLGNDEPSCKKKLINLLSYLSFLINNDSSVLEIQKLMRKEFVGGNATVFDSANELISFYINIGILNEENNGRLSFVHRCFGEFLYAMYLTIKYKPESESLIMLDKANKNELSEVLFYLCWHKKNIDSFILASIEGNRNSIKLCFKLLAYEKASYKITISKDIFHRVDTLLSKLKIKDEPFFNEMRFHQRLEKLRVADPLSDRPLFCKDAKTLFRIHDEYQCRKGCLVGLSPKEIGMLVKRINGRYPDDKGVFSIPDSRYQEKALDDDTVIDVAGSYQVVANKSPRFMKIREIVSENARECMQNDIFKANARKLNSHLDKARQPILESAMKLWNPNILLTNDLSVYENEVSLNLDEYSKAQFDNIRDRCFGDANTRATFTRNYDLSDALFGEEYEDRLVPYSRTLSFEDLIDYEKLGLDDIQSLIRESLLVMYKSLQFNSSYGEFGNNQLKLCRLFTIYAIYNCSIAAWGKIRIVYNSK